MRQELRPEHIAPQHTETEIELTEIPKLLGMDLRTERWVPLGEEHRHKRKTSPRDVDLAHEHERSEEVREPHGVLPHDHLEREERYNEHVADSNDRSVHRHLTLKRNNLTLRALPSREEVTMNRKLPLRFIFGAIVSEPNITSKRHEHEASHEQEKNEEKNRESDIDKRRLHPPLTTRHRMTAPVEEVLATEIGCKERDEGDREVRDVRLSETTHWSAPLSPNDLHDHRGHDSTEREPLEVYGVDVESSPRLTSISEHEPRGKHHDPHEHHKPKLRDGAASHFYWPSLNHLIDVHRNNVYVRHLLSPSYLIPC